MSVDKAVLLSRSSKIESKIVNLLNYLSIKQKSNTATKEVLSFIEQEMTQLEKQLNDIQAELQGNISL